MMSLRPAILRLCESVRGAAVIEFALVAPLFLFTLFGVLDYGMQFYGKHILQGAVSQAARNSTLENFADDQDELDDLVEQKVRQVFGGATLDFTRRAYLNYEDVGQKERIIDEPSDQLVTRVDGRLDAGECFIDSNGNKKWDEDRGREGNGGPEDVVLYEVTMTFDRMFPFWSLAGQSQQSTMKAATLLRNQPFGEHTVVEEKICPPSV